MGNTWFKQSQTQLTMVCAIAFLALLALVSELLSFPFSYGISFTCTSLFVLLMLRLFGLWPSLLTAGLILSISIFLFDQPLYHSILFLEVLLVGLLLRRYKQHLFSLDSLFWILVGIPLIFFLYAKDSLLNATDLLLITVMIAMNGLFNSLFAEIIDHYFPLRRWAGLSQEGKEPRSFRKVLFHFSFGIVFVSFLLNIFLNSLSSFKEVTLYAQGISSIEAQRLMEAWDTWLASEPFLMLTEAEKTEEQILFFQRLMAENPEGFRLYVTNKDDFILASNQLESKGEQYDWRNSRKVTAINSHLSLTIPSEPRHIMKLRTWHEGLFVYTEDIRFTDWNIFLEAPIKNYQRYLFSKYFTHFFYLIGLSGFTAALAFIINRSLSQKLLHLTEATTNLPLKLHQMKNVDWPSSSIVEIHSLIANFKDTSTNLIHMFQESQQSNVQLETQAFMLLQSEERLNQLAYYDMLTGLPNRHKFTIYLQDLIALYDTSKQPIAVMYADVNRFKQINDTLGHAVGDELLRMAAERFKSAMLNDCTVFRLGGDEFVFVGHYENEEMAAANAQAVVDSFHNPFSIEGTLLFLTVSVGVSLYPQDGEHMDTIIRNADIAMYNAKEQGDGCYRFYQPTLVSAMTEKMQIENGLYNALQQNQLSLYYQPKVIAATGELSGIEALIRWHHPELGMVPPDKFIPLAEESGFILDIDSWVFREACRQNKAWQDEGLQRVCVSVNISARHFYQGNLSEMITQVLSDTGLEPQYVSLEITEGVFMQNIEQVIETILYLRSLGIQISIDDFGTGFSSLNQLQRLPISDVKLDRSFIQGITNDEKKSSIVKAIIELVHSMNMRVIAEGVETVEESKFCTDLHCDELQGYLFSRPIPPKEFEQMLRKTV
ncbi:putative bifunctional diguanylate cyclase/phosphodiesterase [Paenibacillus sinopodophylli]|uniref:putative bifunctional diguanylate cyclase/phosphodiesterase n=1 Tax=Paenibacillus sinopodophylli TaxID=1837342 RepID=UPI00110CEB1E|nr:EAL domain-containing protein [Paenibacillus sinopodophylli]